MKSSLAIYIGLLGTLSLSTSVAIADPVEHTNWCFQDDTSNRLIDQPMDRGNCAALLAGGAAVAYFSNNQEAASLVLSSRQYDWADRAAQLSCRKDPVNEQIAIRLIQACQCHNTDAQQEIENNQTEVLQTLRTQGGC